ncbi:MAG TPA: hypothetical protein DIW30_06075 [Bacteroidales bacterium]|nr:hypothetical protein [Bacteroidales bacterium]
MDKVKHMEPEGLECYRMPDGIEIYSLPLAVLHDKKRTEREAEAETVLVAYVFGQEAKLVHRDTGEPYVLKEDEEWNISISHSRNRLCLARATKRVDGNIRKVGVDVENVQERLFRLKDKFLSPFEQSSLELDALNLALCWCAKEAVYKIVGSAAGYMGENIVLHTEQICGKQPFLAWCKGTRFRIIPVRVTDEEVMVVAVSLTDYHDWFLREHDARHHHLAVLLDPDKTDEEHLPALCEYIREGRISCVLVGGSGYEADIAPFVETLQTFLPEIPVVLFPGSPCQLTAKADAMLLLSLISGRDPRFLIGQHIEAVTDFRREILETIPTGYILVDGGKRSSAERVSGTTPLRDVQQVVDTACAGALLGMKLIYLEAGSGAAVPVSPDWIKRVRQEIDLPLVVGGGIRTVEQMHAAFRAGADVVVIGNHFEQHPEDIVSFGQAVDKE